MVAAATAAGGPVPPPIQPSPAPQPAQVQPTEGGEGAPQTPSQQPQTPQQADGTHAVPPQPGANEHLRQPWEWVDEIAGTLKTQAPMLHPSLETLADQINSRFKPNSEEEIYRFILALVNEAIQVSTIPRDASAHQSTNPFSMIALCQSEHDGRGISRSRTVHP